MKVKTLSDYEQGRLIIWQNRFLTHPQGNVKYLIKTLDLHMIVIESSQYMFNHHK